MSDVKTTIEKAGQQAAGQVRSATREAIAREPYTWVTTALIVGAVLGASLVLIVRAVL